MINETEKAELATLILKWDAVDITPEQLARLDELEKKRDDIFAAGAIHILSLGAGVQSTTMALMAARGEIQPMPSCAIFADTQDEPAEVMRHLTWLERQLPFPVYRVTAGNLMAENIRVRLSGKSNKLYLNGKIPAFVTKPDGKRGLLGRKCTTDFKIRPIHQKAREICGVKYGAWRKKFKRELAEVLLAKEQDEPLPLDAWNAMQDDPLVLMWIGISSDEATRSKQSQEPWIKNIWPLLAAKKSRQDCEKWLSDCGYPKAPRSACKKCPFHSDEEWALQTPEDFAESVQYEKDMQAAARSQEVLKGVPFLHESCKPLDQIDFSKNKPGYQQLDKFQNECEGLCGV